MEAAKARALALVRLKISVALDAVDDPTFKADAALLTDDTPERAAADLDLLRRWAAAHPHTLYPAEGAHARITTKLDTMGQRLEAHP